jgi:hypothetical protein
MVIALNDAAVTFEPETSSALGFMSFLVASTQPPTASDIS